MLCAMTTTKTTEGPRGTPAVATIALTALLLAGCSSIVTKHRDWSGYTGPGAQYFDREETPLVQPIDDPGEPTNRRIGTFNHVLIRGIVEPIAHGYAWLVPKGAREGIGRFAANLAFPVRALNALVQGKPAEARDETYRFGINTTVGVLGFMDPAEERYGIEPIHEDTGQTLGTWGWNPNAFVMLPVAGPSNDRDAVGLVGDLLLNPATYFFPLNLFFGLNTAADEVDTYVRFIQSQADPYALARYALSIARREAVSDYVDRPRPESDSSSVQTLNAVFLTFEDPELPRRVEHHEAALPGGRSIPYTLLMQPHPAPLFVILPGMGGHRLGNSSLGLLERAWHLGFSGVTISSPLNIEFIEHTGSTGLPGHALVDAYDTHVAADAIVRDLRDEHPGMITGLALGGLSMGAFHTLLIAAAEGRPDHDLVAFDRYLAINSPVSLTYGMGVLDDMFNAPVRHWPEETRLAQVDLVMRRVFALVRNEELEFGDRLPFTEVEAEFLIGLTYRLVLRDAIWASQWKHDMGVLLTELDEHDRTPAYYEINRYSWLEYYYAFALPYYLEHDGTITSDEQMAALNDLHHVADELRRNEKIYIAANRNDFLMRPGDIEFLADVVGPERAHIFEVGGHLGNLLQPDVRECLRRSVIDLVERTEVAER